MLTHSQVTEVEGVYIAIVSLCISDDLIVSIIEHFYKINLEQFIYLKWLLRRWTFIRKNNNHMPKRLMCVSNSLS